jgi:tetratricopeptide (TPR) repeat protein
VNNQQEQLAKANRLISAGDYSQAEKLLKNAIAGRQKPFSEYTSLAVLYGKMGNMALALESFKNALEIQSNHLPALIGMGILQIQCKDYEAGIRALEKADTVSPRNRTIHFNLGIAYYGIGNHRKAIAHYQKALRVSPTDVAVLSNLGTAYKAQGNLDNAISTYEKAIRIEPLNTTLYFNLGNTLKEQLRFESALQCYREAEQHQHGDCSSLRINQALCLYGLERHQEALKLLKEALAKNHEHAGLLGHLGILHAKQGEYAEGIAYLDQAIKADPETAEWWFQRGIALCESGKRTIGFQSLEQALNVDPNHADARLALSLEQLRGGDFQQGWTNYRARWRTCKSFPKQRYYDDIITKPEWEPGIDNTVLVWAEQGIGDEIMFSSMIPELLHKKSKIILQTDHRLEPLLHRSFGKHLQIVHNHTAVDHSCYASQIAIGSLAEWLRRDSGDFEQSQHGFLKADQERATQFREQLGLKPGEMLVGISWDSNSARDWNQVKRMALIEMAAAIHNPSIRWVNLQYGDTERQISELYKQTGIAINQIESIDRFQDLDGLAALIQACDSVVTISNCTAHLCGALGKRGHLLLPFRSDWRWGLDETTTVWYKSLTLYRQPQHGDWQTPLAQLKDALLDAGHKNAAA